MPTRPVPLFAALVLAQSVAVVAPASGQEETSQPICRTSPCAIVVDWGAGSAPATVDRRFGSPRELEQRVTQALVAAGYRAIVDAGATGFRIRIRPSMAAAMCDRVPGTNPDMSCSAISEVRVEFVDADPAWKLGTLRIRNRCGSDDQMDVEKFSTYLAGMLDYTLARDKNKKRPAARC